MFRTWWRDWTRGAKTFVEDTNVPPVYNGGGLPLHIQIVRCLHTADLSAHPNCGPEALCSECQKPESLEQRWLAFLKEHPVVLPTWRELNSSVLPTIYFEEGRYRLYFNIQNCIVEIEIHQDGSREWFWRNRTTGDFGGTEGETRDPLDDQVLGIMRV